MAAGWAALAGAANAYTQQDQAAREDQRWSERYELMRKSEADAARAKQRFMAATEPPKVQAINTTNAKGEQITQQQQWVPPSDEEMAAGTAGHWNTVGEAPNINFERLEETGRHNKESEEARQRQLDLTGQLNAARMEAAGERAARAGGEKAFSFADYSGGTPEQRALYDRYRRGESSPDDARDVKAREATLKDLQEHPPKDDADAAQRLYANQTTMGANPFGSVKASASTTAAAPMGQFDSGGGGRPKAQARPAPREGEIVYDKQGRKYVVKNGVPVPA